jgi:hypothetical protein
MRLETPDWPTSMRRYLVATLVLHLVWEVVQLPLYTIWSDPLPVQAFAVAHCTVGDVMIAGLSLLIAITIVGIPSWPHAGARPVWLLTVLLGLAYTIYSEWMNVNVRGSWAYAPSMPTLPILGTGLAPLMQWLVVPTLALGIAIGRWPWVDGPERQ